jgi:uncharacterized membrane protein
VKIARIQALGVAATVIALTLAIALYYPHLEWRTRPWHAFANPLVVAVVVGLLVFCIPPIVFRNVPGESSETARKKKLGRVQPLSVALVVGSFVAAAVLRTRQADVFILPAVMSVFWLWSVLGPRFLPPRNAGEESLGQVGEVVGLLMVFMAGLARVGVLGPSIRFVDVDAVGFGVLLISFGNVMGKIPRSYTAGIRTPWTLASKEVWLRTHRISGPVYMVAGALLIGADLTGTLKQALLPILGAVAVIPWILSYALARRLQSSNTV